MELTGKPILIKLKKKNAGNKQLCKAIDLLIQVIETASWKDPYEVRKCRSGAGNVYPGVFFVFNISSYRALILIEFETQESTVVFAETHDTYERLHRNNKNTIEAYLRQRNWIS